jgi:hypothetical protein
MVITNRLAYFKKMGLPSDSSFSLAELAKISKYPLAALQEVYNRGIGAYSSSPQSVRMKGTFEKGVNAPMSQKLSKEQWAMGRVYALLNKATTVFNIADADIVKKYGLK